MWDTVEYSEASLVYTILKTWKFDIWSMKVMLIASVSYRTEVC